MGVLTQKTLENLYNDDLEAMYKGQAHVDAARDQEKDSEGPNVAKAEAALAAEANPTVQQMAAGAAAQPGDAPAPKAPEQPKAEAPKEEEQEAPKNVTVANATSANATNANATNVTAAEEEAPGGRPQVAELDMELDY